MNSDPKYVYFEGYLCDFVVMFPPTQSHAKVARGLENLGKPVSAGFFSVKGERALAYGESDSLRLKAVPGRDGRRIDQALRLGDYAGA